MIKFTAHPSFDKEATIIFCDQSQIKQNKIYLFHQKIQEAVKSLIDSHQFSAKKDQIFPLVVNKRLFVLVGLGQKEELSLTAIRIAARRVLLTNYLKETKEIEMIPHDQADSVLKAFIEGVLIGTYSWDKYKTKIKDKYKEKHYYLVTSSKQILHETIKICEGVNFTRNLINDNADTVTSEYLEKIVRQLTKGRKNISIEVFNRRELKTKGLNLHLAVNQGSRKEPKLILVKYRGSSKRGYDIAFVGKGMTFDTGGLNLKPTGSIETMRIDMSGAAAVVGILKNTIALNPKKNIIFVLGIAENVIGSGAYKPGDVFRSYSGKTVEIGNTDAEGRLVLADAISYVVKNYKPVYLVDIATLTGACVVALGHDYSGLVTTDDEFSRKIVRCSNETDDRVWRLPNYPELKDSVKSQIADMKNLGFPKGAAGALTAAEFLRQFIEKTIWAHLDIAGTAFVENQEHWYYGHGATGAGVRLLTSLIQKI